jgi:hypothetical protein
VDVWVAAPAPGQIRPRGQAPAAAVAAAAGMLDVADSDANTAAFITSRNRRGAGAFAKVRLMTLIEVGTHAVIDAVFGAESEQVLAGRL